MRNRLDQLHMLHAAMITLDKKKVAELFMDVLAKSNSVYHFDEDAHTMIDGYTSEVLFSSEEATLCNTIRNYCYDNYLFELALNSLT